MEHVLVTGGLGFIGSHTVVELLESGYTPVIVDNLSNAEPWVLNQIEQITGVRPPFCQVDCTDRLALARVLHDHAPVRAVIHFAAMKAVGESVAKPLQYYRNNLLSLLNVLELMAEHAVDRLVFSSSATVYGSPRQLPVDESSPVQQATSPYGETKIVGEQMIASAVHARPSFRCVALRYFNPIGAHPSGLMGELPQGVPSNLIPYITQTARGLHGELAVFGHDYDTPDGTPLRDYFHVMDLARAHVQALQRMEQGEDGARYIPINVGAGSPSSVLEIVREFEAVNGVRVPYKLSPRRPGDVPAIWASTQLARRLLGWQPRYTLRDALAHAWQWECHLSSMPRSR